MAATKEARERTRASAAWIGGLRLHPLIHATLKARAAFTRITIEKELHACLCTALDRADLADAEPNEK